MVCTIIVRYKLKTANRDFLGWKQRMDQASRQAVGFLDRTELPSIPTEPYYSVILRFDNKFNAAQWFESPIREKLLKDVESLAEERQEILHDNNSFWFGLWPRKKAKWKEVIVSFIAVYPLTQIVPAILQFVLKELEIASRFLSGVLTGVLISACMVYFAMPLVIKLFKKWLIRVG